MAFSHSSEFTMQEQAQQSGFVFLDKTAVWNEEDWPPLVGGGLYDHALVVLDHPDNNNNEPSSKRSLCWEESKAIVPPIPLCC